MTKEDIAKLEEFQEKLLLLRAKHRQTVERNKELESALLMRQTEYQALEQRFAELEQKYNNLKQAKVISLSDQEISITQERLTKLVREIDQCIASLTK
jgi:hypothetical protein